MKVLVTGSNGQLGSSIKSLALNFPKIEFIYTDIDDLDLTNKADLNNYFKDNKFDYLVNCAGYTAVDRAEEEPEKARLVNVTAVENIVEQSNLNNIILIHISTDYVFGGKNFRPYTEEDMPDPLSIYAITKRDAETHVIKNCNNGIILRTSWLYSEYGKNFLKTILALADKNSELRIIADQIGTPTYAGDLSRAILEIINQNFKTTSLFNFSNQGVASWYDFANGIVQVSGKDCLVTPISTEEYPLPAARPFYSVMDKRKFTTTFNYKIPHWTDSLQKCLADMS